MRTTMDSQDRYRLAFEAMLNGVQLRGGHSVEQAWELAHAAGQQGCSC